MKKPAKKRHLPQCGIKGISYIVESRRNWSVTIPQSICGVEGGVYIRSFKRLDKAKLRYAFELGRIEELGLSEWLTQNPKRIKTEARYQSGKPGVTWQETGSDGGCWQVRATVGHSIEGLSRRITIGYAADESDAIELIEDWERLGSPDDIARFLGWFKTRMPRQHSKYIKKKILPAPIKFSGKSWETLDSKRGRMARGSRATNDLW